MGALPVGGGCFARHVADFALALSPAGFCADLVSLLGPPTVKKPEGLRGVVFINRTAWRRLSTRKPGLN